MIAHPDKVYIGGRWRNPTSNGQIRVIDSTNGRDFAHIAEAVEADIGKAVGAAREAFDQGPWPRLTHSDRGTYLEAIASEMRKYATEVGEVWTRESGVLHRISSLAAETSAQTFEYYASLASSYAWEEEVSPTVAPYGLLVREPVGVVGAIIPWNSPLGLISYKVAPALLAGCTLVVKCSPEAPLEGYVFAEVAEAAGIPPGVINVIAADRTASEKLVLDERVDKITFTGSTVTGGRIAAICGSRIARCSLELGGKSAAVILDDYPVDEAARTLVSAECMLSGQVCASVTRIIVPRHSHDDMVAAMADAASAVRVGDPFDSSTDMGPLVTEGHLQRVERYIELGTSEGANLAYGGRRPVHLAEGFYIQPTIFGNVDNRSRLAQEEIFGPVLSVIPADGEEDAIAKANESMYGLNSMVFTTNHERAVGVTKRLRAGTVGQNGIRPDFGVAFGGFKKSGIGREGGREGLMPFLETKTVLLAERPAARSPAARA